MFTIMIQRDSLLMILINYNISKQNGTDEEVSFALL